MRMLFRLAVWSFVLVLVFAGCTRRAELARPPAAQIRVVHAGETIGPIDVFIDNVREIESLAYPSRSEYVGIQDGDHRLRVYPAETMENLIGETESDFKAGRKYTGLVFGNEDGPKFLLLTDDSDVPSDKARIRFIHVGLETPNVDFQVLTTAKTLFRNVAYGRTTRYTDIDPGVYEMGSAITGIEKGLVNVPNVEIQAGSSYTVVMSGALVPNILRIDVYEEK